MVTIVNSVAIMLKIFIFNGSISKDEKYFHIWFMCCTLGKRKDNLQEERLTEIQ